MQLQLQFIKDIQYTQCNYYYNSGKTFSIHNATTIQFMENIYYTQCNYSYNSRKTFNIHNATTITIHEKHLIYTMQLQLQFTKNI